MAKYIEYTPDIFAQQDTAFNAVNVWWLPSNFCQSRLGDRIIGSNACTLIVSLLAGRIHDFKLKIWGFVDQPISRMLLTSLAEAIVEGNEIHENLRISGQLVNGINLTVPEAVDAVRYKYPFLTEWIDRTRIITRPIGQTLAEMMQPSLIAWITDPPFNKIENSDLFIVLVADTRTVLFIYQTDTDKVTVMDSHSHVGLNAGAVIAQTRLNNLSQLCQWYSLMCSQMFGTDPSLDLYELSYLYIKNPDF